MSLLSYWGENQDMVVDNHQKVSSVYHDEDDEDAADRAGDLNWGQSSVLPASEPDLIAGEADRM